jgi:hypothetical protein
MRRQKTDDRRQRRDGSDSVGKSLLERSSVISHWSLVSEVNMLSELRSLKASKPGLDENSNALYDFRHFDAFSDESVHLKKPSGGPKGLIGPPCHGALAAGGKKGGKHGFI